MAHHDELLRDFLLEFLPADLLPFIFWVPIYEWTPVCSLWVRRVHVFQRRLAESHRQQLKGRTAQGDAQPVESMSESGKSRAMTVMLV